MIYRVKQSHAVDNYIINEGLLVKVVALGNESVKVEPYKSNNGSFSLFVPYSTFHEYYEKYEKKQETQSKPIRKHEKSNVVFVTPKTNNWEALPKGYVLVNRYNNCSCLGKNPCWMYHDRTCESKREEV